MADYIQEIYYGSPGSGKSHSVKEKYGVGNKKEFKYRITFHPDTDYASFVGCYKPVSSKDCSSIADVQTIANEFNDLLVNGTTMVEATRVIARKYWFSVIMEI